MWRALGLVLVLLVVGAAGGYAVGELTGEGPVSAGSPEPVPAVSPDVPTPPTVSLLPDPDTAPLATNIPTRQVLLRTSKRGWALFVDEPVGWRRTRQAESDWSWAVPDIPSNTYVLRVGILRADQESIAVAKTARIAALLDAQSNGNLSNFEIEAETDDTLIATYVAGGHLRVTMQRWVTLDDSNLAYAVAAVTGRTVDRTGLMDLLERTTDSMRPG